MMTWYFKVVGAHTHVRCYANHALCGTLCFRNEEFDQIRSKHSGLCDESGCPQDNGLIEFINETKD